MELFAVTVWILGGMVAAPMFCFVLATFIRPRTALARILFYPAVCGLCLFVLEVLAVGLLGAARSRELIGPMFFPLHSLVTLMSAAFLASSLLLGPRNVAQRWLAVAVVSWILGVFSILYHYGVAEALYGIDGVGGPYSELNGGNTHLGFQPEAVIQLSTFMPGPLLHSTF